MKSSSLKTTSNGNWGLLLMEPPPPPYNKKIKTEETISEDEAEYRKVHHHREYHKTVAESEKNIQQISKHSNEKLGRRLDIIREQIELAFKQKNYPAFELLLEWERQTIESRLIKFDSEMEKSKKSIRE